MNNLILYLIMFGLNGLLVALGIILIIEVLGKRKQGEEDERNNTT